jgi:hypothetical protein
MKYCLINVFANVEKKIQNGASGARRGLGKRLFMKKKPIEQEQCGGHEDS